jgi:2-polyprenyl-3-methyl-5-hydroxy-6-metoxy-1,4-benzoquinol methylase
MHGHNMLFVDVEINKMNNPPSPITGTTNTRLTDEFTCMDIIWLYQTQLQIDVSGCFRGRERFSMYQCNDTGYRFYHPADLDGDGLFYANLQQRLGDGYYHDWKFENQLAYDFMNPGDRVLDIGCGVGKFLDRAKEKAGEATGLELNEKAVEVCRRKGLTVFNERIEKHREQKKEHYDMVCMFQVLEHICDVQGFLENALAVLKKGGKLVVGVPNNEPYFQGYDKYCTLNLPPHHMGLWNRQVFEKTAPLFGLKIRKVVYDVKGSITTHAYLHAKYLAKVKSPAGCHSTGEKIKMMWYGIYTLPLALVKKLTLGINGSHIAIVFEKI